MDIVNDVPTVVILLVASLIIGCIFGSFLNVVIWRVPNHISITNPKRSFCPKCEAPIAWYDNIPIFSWLALGAKCRHCKEPIAARYPLVESLGGLSFLAVTAGGLFGAYPLWALPVLYVFACVSIVIAFIDLDHHLILNVVLLPTLIATVLLLAVASFGIGEWTRLGRGALCALILFVFYFVLSLIWKGGMGVPYDKSKVFVCLESKVFGIGLESYTVGSAEFRMNYVASKGTFYDSERG